MGPAVRMDGLEESRPQVGILQIFAPLLTSNHFTIFEIASNITIKG